METTTSLPGIYKECDFNSTVHNISALNRTDGVLFDGEGNGTKPAWKLVLDSFQAVSALAGFIANSLTLATLIKNNSGMGHAVSILFRHQAAVDLTLCLLAGILVIAPPMWTTGQVLVDKLVCHIWHSQALYWQLYLVSVWNLVLIAVERFLCVVRPLAHRRFTTRFLRGAIIVIHVFSLAIVGISYTQTRFDGTRCVSEFAINAPWVKTFFFAYGFLVFSLWYMVPVLLFITLYGGIIWILRQRGETLPTSSLISRASSQLTKTAVIVTLIFIISTSYDLWYYLLGRTGLVVYKKNTAVQKVGVFLSVVNCCANPFVYVLCMSSYRRSLHATVTCRKLSPHHTAPPILTFKAGLKMRDKLYRQQRRNRKDIAKPMFVHNMNNIEYNPENGRVNQNVFQTV